MTGRKRWVAFAVTMFLCLAVATGGSLHVLFRWEPEVVGIAEVGEWMQFDQFRMRVDQVFVADDLPPAFGEELAVAPVEGMKLMQVLFTVDKQNFTDFENDTVCDVWIENRDGARMTGHPSTSVVGPMSLGCMSPDQANEFGDQSYFQSQIVMAVTPEPLHTFSVRFEHLTDSGNNDMWIVRVP